jgi:hypothetical protein
MSWMEFEATIPEFEQAKTGHALDRVATVIGWFGNSLRKFLEPWVMNEYRDKSLMHLKCMGSSYEEEDEMYWPGGEGGQQVEKAHRV